MIVFCIELICIFSAIAFWRIEKKIFNPVSVFCGIWAVITFLSNLQLFGLYETSENTYFLILIGIISYILGVFISTFGIKWKKRNINGNNKNTINYGVLYFLGIIALFFLLLQFSETIALLLQGYDMAHIRYLYTGDELNSLRTSVFRVTMNDSLCTPMVYLISVVVVVHIMKGNRDKKLIGLAFSLVFLSVFNTAGRAILIWIVLYIVCGISVYGKNIRITAKMKKVLLVSVIIIGILFFSVTKSRLGEGYSILQQGYLYFATPIKFLDTQIEKINSVYNNVLGFGAASFYGFIYIILFFFRVLGLFNSYPEFFENIRYLSFSMLEDTVYIGENVRMNAYATIFFQPYIDGRIIGIIIELALFGFIVGYAYRKAYLYKTDRWVIIYLLLFQKIVFSMVRFYFTQPSQAICIILAIIITTKKIKFRRKT